MKLYLVQHGEAVSKDIDPERPLSGRGQEDVRRLAGFLSEAGVRVARVLHSGKRRAGQTAALLAGAVLPGGTVESVGLINPNDAVETFARDLGALPDETMVVGHLPFMARLVSLLLTRDQERLRTGFVPGTIVCLESGDDGVWAMGWMIRPELLGAGGQKR
jgi:phosphohistidine phosphatase